MSSYESIVDGIMKGDVDIVEAEVNKALDEGAKVRDILMKGLIGGMAVVGERFGAGDMFLPEVLMSASAMHRGLNIIKPSLAASGQKAMGSIVIGTVEGDIHDIGKRIVGALLEGSGFEIVDLGVDVPSGTFTQAVEEHKPNILGMSALLTTTMPNMGKTIELLKKKGLRNNVKIIVGGASITQEFADSIGADGYAEEASSAVELVKKLIAK